MYVARPGLTDKAHSIPSPACCSGQFRSRLRRSGGSRVSLAALVVCREEEDEASSSIFQMGFGLY
jgi:hypothetical protein